MTLKHLCTLLILHGSPSPLWQSSTSCRYTTLCALFVLHECKAPLCPNNTSCFYLTFVVLRYFMIPAHFNAWLVLHEARVLFMPNPYFMHDYHFNGKRLLHELNLHLWMAFTSCQSFTFEGKPHFMRLLHFYVSSVLHVNMKILYFNAIRPLHDGGKLLWITATSW